MIISNDEGYQINKYNMIFLGELGDITYFFYFFIHEIIIRVTPSPVFLTTFYICLYSNLHDSACTFTLWNISMS